ncbi:MAG: serine hydrolase domain-containing protein, partial [Bacteroidota bacterium]
MYIRSLILLLSLTIGVTVGQKRNSEATSLAAFDVWATAGMKDWSMPGMAVAVVRDGKVVFMKGYGTRELGKDAPVDVHTVFSIGSTTKAMTAVCMAMLVDEGKVSWDDAVINHLPDFQLHDSYVTRTLRIRDLFTHNSGVGNADFLWSNINNTQDDIVKKMAMVEPSYPLRGGFIYQNIFYLIAAKVIERTSGKPWSVLIRERIFTPLGMVHTVPHFSDANPGTISSAHYKVNGKVMPINRMTADAVDAAGSVYGCIDDISKWAIAMLDSSKYSGGRLLKPATWTELFRPQVIVPASQMYPTMQLVKPSWTTYGLGWFQHDYKGRKINYHTGSLPGEIAMHAQLPSEK